VADRNAGKNEAVEVESNIVDLEDDCVELQNGIAIPVLVIYEVGV
jgi:hypothetical protein